MSFRVGAVCNTVESRSSCSLKRAPAQNYVSATAYYPTSPLALIVIHVAHVSNLN